MMPFDEIAAERKRQIDECGYDAAHDDKHTDGSIAKAASAYAAAAINSAVGVGLYPWGLDGFRPTGARNSLIIAAALCLAEIERIDRANAQSPELDS